MTYCVALRMRQGLVFMSDTRTNAGVDNISMYKKMFTWPGKDRFITLMTAGNLATTQSVVSLLDERTKVPAERRPSILETPTMFQTARLVGETLREVIRDSQSGEAPGGTFDASLILGGQIGDMEQRLFLIYPEGNFVEASDETPFFQIGETKYGRPIIVRLHQHDMSLDDAVKLLMVSFDSTIKANLSVAMPLDLLVLERDRLTPAHQRRIETDDLYFAHISNAWGDALRQAFDTLPAYRVY